MLAVEAGNLATPSVLRASALRKNVNDSWKAFQRKLIRSYHAAAQSGNLSEVDRFLTEGIYVDVTSEDKQTALMLATRSGARDVTSCCACFWLPVQIPMLGLDPRRVNRPFPTQLLKVHSDIAAMLTP